jgi:hypothetical protein
MTEPKDDKGESDMDTDDETRRSELEEEGRRLLDVTESPTKGQPHIVPGSNDENIQLSPGKSVKEKLGRLSKSSISVVDIPSLNIIPVPGTLDKQVPLKLPDPLPLPGTSKQSSLQQGKFSAEIPGVPTNGKNNNTERILLAKGQVPLPVPPPPPVTYKKFPASLLYGENDEGELATCC